MPRSLAPLSILSLVFLAAASAGAGAAAPSTAEFGLKGVKRVEIVFVNVGGKDADELAPAELAKDPDCAAIGTTLTRAGLEIVEKCKKDDLACAQLYLSVENVSTDRLKERLYLAGLDLVQRVVLARDKKVVLTTPSTLSAHRVTIVAADQSARAAACADLRGMATFFGSGWRVANK